METPTAAPWRRAWAAVIALIGLQAAIVAVVRRSASPARARWASIIGGSAVVLAAIALEHPDRRRFPTFSDADLDNPALLAAGGALGLAVLVAAAVFGSRPPLP